jgi:hypothetical protein
MSELSAAQRQEILKQEIARYVGHGWVVVNETETSANLVRKKRFSFWWALLWFLFLIVGLIVYIFYYLSKDDETLYIDVDSSGKVSRTAG